MSFKDTVTQLKDIVVQAGQTFDEAIEENKRQGKIKLDICKSCDKFNMTTRFCGVCHCFMPAKTRIPGQHCPENKW